ncbi:AfsA-related hotdog domain-containing protein [Photobacterium halotolerans]|uniref:A-factor biosynthesis hotdog domain-containing protein n=1 Tax=Photobacterium halotolerans TaxID=265726 RepID=A0A0F5V9N1_9GAMM|nr:AfsA-related hotdog domain-containing protein [Photobacterium halotolerans]KKC98481.1 hypothetical protein KY46_18005 [Photobacterium halotolerans]
MSHNRPENCITVIVADMFKNFADSNENVLTYSCLVKQLAKHQPSGQAIKMIAGQGVTKEELMALITRYDAQQDYILMTPQFTLPRAGCEYSHKHKQQNITVSLAQKLSENSYKLALTFDGGNEFFQDHMTGQHIQGMAVIESMRQAFLAVTEQFFLADTDEGYYFVIHEMATRFERFVFPVEAHVHYHIEEQRVKSGRYYAQVKVTVEQGGNTCAISNISFTAYNSEFIAEKESQIAQATLNTYLTELEETAQHFEASHAAA